MAAKKKAAAKDDEKVEKVSKGSKPAKDDTAAPAVTAAAKELAKAEAANPKQTAEEKTEAAAEKERREKRVIEANERAMRDGQVAKTVDGRTGVAKTKAGVVIFNQGAYAFQPLSAVPTWYLHHLMGDALDYIKWRSLTKEQQTEVSEELNRRKSDAAVDQSIFPPGQGSGAVSDLETVQERRAKEASPIPVGSGPQTPTFGKAESLGKGTGTIGGPGGLPEVEGSRKDTDEAIDRAAESGSVGTGEKDSKGGVTGVETGTSTADAPTKGKAKRTSAAQRKK